MEMFFQIVGMMVVAAIVIGFGIAIVRNLLFSVKMARIDEMMRELTEDEEELVLSITGETGSEKSAAFSQWFKLFGKNFVASLRETARQNRDKAAYAPDALLICHVLKQLNIRHSYIEGIRNEFVKLGQKYDADILNLTEKRLEELRACKADDRQINQLSFKNFHVFIWVFEFLRHRISTNPEYIHRDQEMQMVVHYWLLLQFFGCETVTKLYPLLPRASHAGDDTFNSGIEVQIAFYEDSIRLADQLIEAKNTKWIGVLERTLFQ